LKPNDPYKKIRKGSTEGLFPFGSESPRLRLHTRKIVKQGSWGLQRNWRKKRGVCRGEVTEGIYGQMGQIENTMNKRVGKSI